MLRKNVIFLLILGVVYAGISGCGGKKSIKPEIVKPPNEGIEEPASPKEEEPSIRGQEFQALPELQTVYFDYDQTAIDQGSGEILQKNAKYLEENRDLEILVEGNCCECATNEYNMSLGQQRSQIVRDYYIKLGVAPNRVATISYGEEKPVNPNVAPPDSPLCKQNRRADTKVRKSSK